MSSLTAPGNTCAYTPKQRSKAQAVPRPLIANRSPYAIEDSLNCGKLALLVAYLRGSGQTAKAGCDYPAASYVAVAANDLNCGKLSKLIAYLRR